MSMARNRKPRTKADLRRSALLIVLAVLVAVFGGLYAASRTFARTQLSNLADVFTAFSVRDDNTFPYPVDSASVVRMTAVGSGIAVLRTDRLDILTKTGATLQSVKHTYTMPAIDVCAGRILLYDRGGTRYMILSKTGVLRAESEASGGSILTAALADDGRYAVATSAAGVKNNTAGRSLASALLAGEDTAGKTAGSGSKSVLTVYNTKGEKFFQYKCVAEYVTDVAFTQNGAAVTLAGVENAETHSRLLVLHFKKTEPLQDLAFENTTFFHVNAFGSAVTACSRDLLTRLDGKTHADTRFDSDTLQYYCADASGKATLVLLTYGNEHETHLLGLQKNGEKAFDADCGKKIKAADRSGVYSGVLTDGAVLIYNNSGAQVGTLTLAEQAQDLCLSDRTAFVLFPDRIESFPAAGTHEQKTSE